MSGPIKRVNYKPPPESTKSGSDDDFDPAKEFWGPAAAKKPRTTEFSDMMKQADVMGLTLPGKIHTLAEKELELQLV